MKTTYLTGLALLLALFLTTNLGSLGCKTSQSQSVFDPFFRSQTIPPPGTGTYSAEPGVSTPTETQGVSPYAPSTGQPMSSTSSTQQPVSQNQAIVFQSATPASNSTVEVQSGSVNSHLSQSRFGTSKQGDHVVIPVASYRTTTGSKGANDFVASHSPTGSIAPSSTSSTIMVTSIPSQMLTESQPASVYASRADGE